MTEDGSGIGEGIPVVYGIVVLENGTWRRQEGVLGRSFILGGLALLPLSNAERLLVLGMLLFTDVFLKPYIQLKFFEALGTYFGRYVACL